MATLATPTKDRKVMKSEVLAKQWQLIFRSFLGVIPSSEVNLGVAHFTWCF